MERVGDLLIIVASFLSAYYGRTWLLWLNYRLNLGLPFEGPFLAPLKDYFLVLVVALFVYSVVLSRLGAYGSMRMSSWWRVLWISITASIFALIVLSATLFILKINLSRSFVALFCFEVTILLSIERLTVLRMLRYWRRRGRNFRNLLLCGTGEQAFKVAAEISSRPELGVVIRALGSLKSKEAADLEKDRNLFNKLQSELGLYIPPLLYGAEAIEKSLKERAIDEVLFTDVLEVLPAVEECVLMCSEEGVRTTIAADLFSLGMVHSAMSYFGGMPLIHFQTPPGDRWELTLKRGIDIITSFAFLIFLSPLFLLCAVGVRFSGDGPILFKQKRVGLNGRIFSLYKFRSMYHHAEDDLKLLLENNEMDGPVFKMTDDPRVTPFGRFIRRYSLDELPQLWNVFRGDMSMVGPRPPVPVEVSLYTRGDRRRLSMRPGLTCTWQVSGRNNIKDFRSWVRLDLDYIDNWSLLQDIKLMVRTIPAVLFGTGAR